MRARRVILVFVKWPEPGRVKTRLGAEVGHAEAVTIYRRLVETVISILNKSPADEIRILLDPPERRAEIREWLAPLFASPEIATFHPQATGDLGDRLSAAFTDVFKPEQKVVAAAIGSDCIEIAPSTFEELWSALEKDDTDAVFGPARDGGYYLVGLDGMQPSLFDRIPWSTENTLSATLKQAEAANLRVTLLEQKRDIDTLEDWEKTFKP